MIELGYQYASTGISIRCQAGKNMQQGRIGQRATMDVPGQRGSNITICAELSSDGLLLQVPLTGPFHTESHFFSG